MPVIEVLTHVVGKSLQIMTNLQKVLPFYLILFPLHDLKARKHIVANSCKFGQAKHKLFPDFF